MKKEIIEEDYYYKDGSARNPNQTHPKIEIREIITEAEKLIAKWEEKQRIVFEKAKRI